MGYIKTILGILLKYIYEGVSSYVTVEPANVSRLAISIILISIMFKVLLFPLFLKSMKNQQLMSKFQGEQNKIREKYKNDPQTMNKKLMEFQKEHGIQQLGGCLPMIIQMILVIAMFGVMNYPLYYIFGNENVKVAAHFFWIKDLALPDPLMYGLPLLNAISQYFYFEVVNGDQTQDDSNPAAGMMKNMKYFFPVLIFFSAKNFSAGLALYWLCSNIVEIILKLSYNAYSKRKEECSKDGRK